ncbi:hypothetical protein KAR91_85110 [Candidatus Pacearchaeota archaeon]|nr:hypothetical protein [Candidatus Pacearchaeota archaeon]
MSKEDGKDCKKLLRCTLRVPCAGCDDYEPCDHVTQVKIGEAITEMRETVEEHNDIGITTGTQGLIVEECDDIKDMLLAKNRKYGDSAVNPCRIFSKASPLEQINVRLDDKLSRIMSGQDDEDEDVELDIIGYLILKRAAKRKTS